MASRTGRIHLDVSNKLVYSAHDYPNSVWPQPWFQGDNFAAGLPAKFDQMWGYIYKEGIAPVATSASSAPDNHRSQDAAWLKAITSYMGATSTTMATRTFRRQDRRELDFLGVESKFRGHRRHPQNDWTRSTRTRWPT